MTHSLAGSKSVSVSSSVRQLLARNRSISIALATVVVVSIAAPFLPDYWTQLITRVLIMALFATSLNIQVGYAGMLPLGHAMFLGLGAYSFGLLMLKTGIPLAASFPIAVILSFIITAVIGFLCLRGDSMTFALLHLAFNLLLYTIIVKWRDLTGGEPGFTGVPRPELFAGTLGFYFFVLIVVLICYIIINTMMNSPFARVAQGLRENEERLVFLGINTRRFQLTAFIISGVFAAIAGLLLAMLDRGAFPAYMSLTRSAEGLMMCLIGGMYAFLGPTIGAAIVVVIGTVTSNYINQWQGLLGVIIIGCVIGFRGGILGRRRSKLQLSQEKYEE